MTGCETPSDVKICDILRARAATDGLLSLSSCARAGSLGGGRLVIIMSSQLNLSEGENGIRAALVNGFTRSNLLLLF